MILRKQYAILPCLSSFQIQNLVMPLKLFVKTLFNSHYALWPIYNCFFPFLPPIQRPAMNASAAIVSSCLAAFAGIKRVHLPVTSYTPFGVAYIPPPPPAPSPCLSSCGSVLVVLFWCLPFL